MSHIQTLNRAQQHCESTGDCASYQGLLRNEQLKIDARTASDIQGAITTGVIIALIGVTFFLPAFIKPLRKFHAFLLPKLAIIAPVLVGFAGGVLVGFAVSFSACFKQACSDAENWAVIIVPLASLLVTIPLAVIISHKHRAMSVRVATFKPQTWIVLGLLVICLAAMYTFDGVIHEQQQAELLQQQLTNDPLNKHD